MTSRFKIKWKVHSMLRPYKLLNQKTRKLIEKSLHSCATDKKYSIVLN